MHVRACLAIIACLLIACAAPTAPQSGQGSRTQDPTNRAPKRVVAAILGDTPVLVQALNAFGQRGTDAVEELVHVGFSSIDDKGLLRPVLAEAVPTIENGLWQISPDGRMRTTWKLRQGALWHDGTAVSSEDFAFAFRVAMDREVPEFADAALSFIDSVEVLDELTIQATWLQPYIEADRIFATRGPVAPMPRHILGRPFLESKATFTQLPHWSTEFIGTGPYRLRELALGSHVSLEAFDRYLLGKPKIDSIEVRFVLDPTTIVANILAGAIDVTLGKTLSVEQAIEVRDQWRDGVMVYGPSNAISIYPQFMGANPPIITNVQLRRALLHGINRQELADTLLAGLSSVAHSYMYPNQAQYRDIEARLPRYDHDPRRAVQLIDGLGYSRSADGLYRDSSGQLLSFEVRSSTTDINQKATFAVADGWQKLGLRAEPFVYSRQAGQSNEYLFTYPGFYLQRYTSDIAGLKNLQSSRIPLPENNFRSGNTARYSNPELDGLIDRYFVTIEQRQRTQVLGDILYHVADQVIQLGLFFDAEPTMIAKRISNVTPRWATSTQSWNAHEWDIKS